jgi:two-component sensor histidine kinase
LREAAFADACSLRYNAAKDGDLTGGVRMEARKHPRQGERLRALHAYAILDSERERAFDEIVTLAAGICGTPIAVMNLIDSDRQWFKAEVGLGVRETPLATSICAHIILDEDFVEIGDTLLDCRFSDNPLCSGGASLRFYAGALLKTEEGLPIGTLCVIDTVPRALNDTQRQAIRVLAQQVMARLDLRRARIDEEVLRREVDHRVKNSLQSLAALALVEGEAADSEAVRVALARMRGRIGTVASVHEALHRSESGTRVDLGAFVRRIARLLERMAPAGVRLEVDAAGVSTSARQSTAVGILVNELVANAFKHGFAGGARGGVVRLSVRRLADGRVEVTCADSGIGMSPDAEAELGLGMRIVDLVCAQLDCQLEIASGGADGRGVSASFRFRPEAG